MQADRDVSSQGLWRGALGTARRVLFRIFHVVRPQSPRTAAMNQQRTRRGLEASWYTRARRTSRAIITHTWSQVRHEHNKKLNHMLAAQLRARSACSGTTCQLT